MAWRRDRGRGDLARLVVCLGPEAQTLIPRHGDCPMVNGDLSGGRRPHVGHHRGHKKHANWRSVSDGHKTRERVGLVQYTSRDDLWRRKMLREQIVDPRLVFRSRAANFHKPWLGGVYGHRRQPLERKGVQSSARPEVAHQPPNASYYL